MVDFSTPSTEFYKHISVAYNESLAYMDGRRTGKIKSLKTPWSKMNESMMDGIEWNTITVIGARPGGGKTLMANMISRAAFDLNPDQDFVVLDFQWEMLARVSAMRELSSKMKKSLKELNSTDYYGPLALAEMRAAHSYLKTQMHRPIYIVETRVNVEGFITAIRKFYQIHKKPMLVTVDHSALINKSPGDKDRFEKIWNLGDALTLLKKELPITFIVLSQLNREIETVERKKPGTVGNYPVPSDLYGSDALTQHADNVIILNRPARMNVFKYGPENFLITDERFIAYHAVKVRNGDERLSWFMDDFENMSILELEAHQYPAKEVKVKETYSSSKY